VESFPTKDEAEKAAIAARRRIPGVMSAAQAVEEFEKHMRDRGNKESSISTTLFRLWTWLEPSAPVNSYTNSELQKIYDRRSREVSAATHQKELANIKLMFKWLKDRAVVTKSPAEGIEPVGKKNKGKKQLRRAEARRFYQVALKKAETGDDGATAALAVLLLGLRSDEIRSRKARDVDVDSDGVLLWIPEGKTDTAVRRLEVPEPLAGILADRVRGKSPIDLLFPSPACPGEYMVRTWLIKVVNRICKEAEVPRVCPHGLRGTWATLTTDAGVSGHVIAREMGHTTYAMTEKHYLEHGAKQRAKTKKMLTVIEGGRQKNW